MELQEKMKKERDERERKEALEEERRQRAKLEAEQKRQAELEKQRQQQLEMEREQEALRKKMIQQRLVRHCILIVYKFKKVYMYMAVFSRAHLLKGQIWCNTIHWLNLLLSGQVLCFEQLGPVS